MCRRPLVDITLFNNINFVKPIVALRQVVLATMMKRERNKEQQRLFHEGVLRVFSYFDDKLCATASDVIKDIGMSPNTIHRNLDILVKEKFLEVIGEDGKKRKRGKKRLYMSYSNAGIKMHLIDVYRLYKQRKQGKTNLEITLLMDIILMIENGTTKNYAAKILGLKSAKSLERIIMNYPSLQLYRKQVKNNNIDRSIFPHFDPKNLL